MKCIYCGHLESKVLDSRTAEDGSSIRRRRECLNCGRRFSTKECVETSVVVLVIKNNGTRQMYSPEKVKNGILKACEKRPVSLEQIDSLVERVSRQVASSMEREVASKTIGNWVMDGLKELDEVAYVRFASVHKEFKDIDTFLSEINALVKSRKDGTKR